MKYDPDFLPTPKQFMIHEPDGEGWSGWVEPILQGYLMKCCDCGLVHEFEFDIQDGRPIFRARRSSPPETREDRT